MITEYVDDPSAWKEWQRASRYGVILLVPPEPFLSGVNALREQHDPWSAGICEAHVSLTVPLPGPLTETDWDALIEGGSSIEPFDVVVGAPISFPPHPGVCLSIEPAERFRTLVETLERTAPFDGAAPRPYPFTPHMTIAEKLSPDRTQPLIAELTGRAPEGVFRCAEVWLSVPDEEFRFTRRRALRLGSR